MKCSASKKFIVILSCALRVKWLFSELEVVIKWCVVIVANISVTAATKNLMNPILMGISGINSYNNLRFILQTQNSDDQGSY